MVEMTKKIQMLNVKKVREIILTSGEDKDGVISISEGKIYGAYASEVSFSFPEDSVIFIEVDKEDFDKAIMYFFCHLFLTF